MIRIALVGQIGSGKTFISKLFGYPVFNADKEVENIYKKDKNCFNKIKKKFSNSLISFPIKKKELIKLILDNEKNLRYLSSIVHPIVRRRMNFFLKKNKNKKIIILDVPLFLENKLNKKNDVIIFIQAKKNKIKKIINKRDKDNSLMKKLKKVQLSVEKKKKKSNFIINNDYTKKTAKKYVKLVLKKILR